MRTTCTAFADALYMIRTVKSGVQKFWARLALLSIEMTTVLIVFIAALAAFVFMTRRVFFLRNEEMDNKAFDALKPFINDGNTQLMNFITFFGKHEFLIPANLFLIAYFLFFKKNKWYSIKIPAIAISSLLLMFGLKQLFARQRPTNQLLEEATNFSFPSGHALMSVTFYGLLAYIVWHEVKNKNLKWALITALILWIILVGASRIYLRRHYYSDVVAGFAMGFLWLVVSLKTIRQLEKRGHKELKPLAEAAS